MLNNREYYLLEMNKVKEDIDKIIIIEHAHGDLINPDHIIKVDKDANGNSIITVD